jgi:hypothetical protein
MHDNKLEVNYYTSQISNFLWKAHRVRVIAKIIKWGKWL